MTSPYFYEYYEYAYDANDNIISLSRFDYYTDELLEYIIYDYDSAGNELGQTCYMVDGTLNWYTINELAYDGSILAIYEYDAYDFVTLFAEYEYDENGNETKQSVYESDGMLYEVREKTYDLDGNMITYTEYDAYGNVNNESMYEYDQDGNPVYFIYLD